MTDKPARKLFQLHLSMALYLMVLAGGLMWLNVRTNPGISEDEIEALNTMSSFYQTKTNDVIVRKARVRGWPWIFQASHDDGGAMIVDPTNIDINTFHLVDDIGYEDLFLNILTTLAILTVAGVGCEWWVRRRGKRFSSAIND